MIDYEDEDERDELDPLRKARREAREQQRSNARSLAATRRQIEGARGERLTSEPDYKPEAEWSTTERQIHAAYGRKPLKQQQSGVES
jgi:hypothetical protein